jgi:hypothetical protein
LLGIFLLIDNCVIGPYSFSTSMQLTLHNNLQSPIIMVDAFFVLCFLLLFLTPLTYVLDNDAFQISLLFDARHAKAYTARRILRGSLIFLPCSWCTSPTRRIPSTPDGLVGLLKARVLSDRKGWGVLSRLDMYAGMLDYGTAQFRNSCSPA